MAQYDPDLHNSISLRPHPFHIHPERSTHNHTPEPNHEHHRHEGKGPATSSAVSKEPEVEHNAISRPGYHRNSSDDERDDVERQGSLPGYEAESDPYKLRSGLKDLDQVKDAAKANTKAKRAAVCRPVGHGKDKLQTHKVLKFYENQNENIERLLKPVDDHVREAKEEQGAEALQFRIAVHGSFAANIVLAILQVYGAVSSGSLSLFTTMADAIFDPMRLVFLDRSVDIGLQASQCTC